jgi:probable F420-dependent oxidoreductase
LVDARIKDHPMTTTALADRLGAAGVWLTLLGSHSADEERRAAQEIEALGYGSLWIGEGPNNKEALSHAGLLLAATRQIVIGTGIANIYVRDPLAMQTGALALADAYPGRFVLGIGVSHAPLVQQRGHDYGRPVTTMRGYLEAMDQVEYGPPPPAQAPRVLAALRPKMLELARDHSDGAHPYLVTPDHTARAREILGTGPALIPEQGVVVEADPERARAVARQHLTPYMQLPNYVNSWRAEGFGDEDLLPGGSDRLVDALVAWGDAETVAARAREHLARGADHVLVQPVSTSLDRALDDLRALAPLLLP